MVGASGGRASGRSPRRCKRWHRKAKAQPKCRRADTIITQYCKQVNSVPLATILILQCQPTFFWPVQRQPMARQQAKGGEVANRQKQTGRVRLAGWQRTLTWWPFRGHLWSAWRKILLSDFFGVGYLGPGCGPPNRQQVSLGNVSHRACGGSTRCDDQLCDSGQL